MGKSGGGKGLANAPVGGTVWGKPGPAPPIPKPGPVAKPLGWKGLVEGSWACAAGVVKGLKAPKASPGLPPPPVVADWIVGTWPAIPKMLLGMPPADAPGPRRLPTSARLLG